MAMSLAYTNTLLGAIAEHHDFCPSVLSCNLGYNTCPGYGWLTDLNIVAICDQQDIFEGDS